MGWNPCISVRLGPCTKSGTDRNANGKQFSQVPEGTRNPKVHTRENDHKTEIYDIAAWTNWSLGRSRCQHENYRACIFGKEPYYAHMVHGTHTLHPNHLLQ